MYLFLEELFQMSRDHTFFEAVPYIFHMFCLCRNHSQEWSEFHTHQITKKFKSDFSDTQRSVLVSKHQKCEKNWNYGVPGTKLQTLKIVKNTRKFTSSGWKVLKHWCHRNCYNSIIYRETCPLHCTDLV